MRPLRPTEFQCPGCGRVFTGDALCESHKRYTPAGLVCLDPAGLGLVSELRGDRIVWMTVERAGKAERLRERQRAVS